MRATGTESAKSLALPVARMAGSYKSRIRR